ncbi:hypothetical protein FN846DRAFT_960602 [Sphaerosporella brunnea]|uniref:MADS-box domain-containing protein n=1 Tax=Sphaerosporella brunnea TaxID=1250544 RepID=A0A5J5EQF7_9PEZI|nr:hypothetical protein FN846DRAFT_960602 [Sphaerosporella brunnea]
MAEHNNSPPQDETAADAASTLTAGNGVPNAQSGVPGSAVDNSRKRPRPSNTGDDDDDEDEGKPGRERRKIEIKFIQDKSRRHITFSKRKAGIMKKAYELSVLTGTQVLLLVVSETGLVYTFTTPKLQPLVTKAEGKNLIQACLNAPEPHTAENGVAEQDPVDSPEEPAHAQLPQQQAPAGARPVGLPMGAGGVPPPYMNMPDAQTQAHLQQSQAQAYQQFIQQQQQQAQVRAGGYMPQHGHPAQNA